MDTKSLYNIINNLQRPPDINGRNEYFNSVVLVLLIEIEDKYNFVFQKRAKGIRQGGEISFPGGRRDQSDKSLHETALRETYEEMGIPPEKINIIGRLDTIVALMGTIIDAFVGVAQIKPEDIAFNKNEVEDVLIIPVDFFINNKPQVYHTQVKLQSVYTDAAGITHTLLPAKQLGLPKRYYKEWGSFKQPVYLYKAQDELIWGLTARLIMDFLSRG